MPSTRQADGLGELRGMDGFDAHLRWIVAAPIYATAYGVAVSSFTWWYAVVGRHLFRNRCSGPNVLLVLFASWHRRLRLVRLPLAPFAAVTALIVTCVGAGQPLRDSPAPPAQQACTYAGTAARCGSLTVWENRASHGRTIALRYAIVPAIKTQHDVPVFFIAGGPGQSAVDLGEGFADDPFFLELHQRHDVVFVDQRGTGRSHPLACDLYRNPSAALHALFPDEAVRTCRTHLEKQADLDMYGSEAAADDLDEIRRALGYGRIDIFGGSYGTTESLVYLRKYDASVNAMLLEGVAPPWFSLPLPFAQGAQHALDDLVAACDADLPCHTHFPNFKAQFASLMQSSRTGIPIAYVDERTNRRVSGLLSREVFADRMRQALYSPDTAALVPMIVDRAYRHDTTPLGKLVLTIARNVSSLLAMGENLSVTCSEDVPFITPEALARSSRETFLGDTRVRAQQRACAIWNVRPVSRAFLDPVRSNVPVLMLSGTDDPATPPQYGAQEAQYLSNGRQLLIPHGGHNNDDPCLTSVETEFIETASVATLDVSCLRRFARPPFVYTLPSLFAD
ncbi:MAG: alpha/beta fold hydrolase [Vulcanimicrobiaceae bacterium]